MTEGVEHMPEIGHRTGLVVAEGKFIIIVDSKNVLNSLQKSR